ncbi:hypothetical protein L6164_024595 [Bauhinia variegata]|uniref:Uncharacterized protein n=1 Tax=Bauhinia variegata TaxID=167791 RepID=A0ACB9LZ82_BAUVA|nr:hypothetical protein L6164_024595 [Bauhinia variegata]
MVAAISTAINPKTATQRGHPQNPTRPPLLPSESDNALGPRRHKAREVTSRYVSSSSSSYSSSSSSSSSSSLSRRFNSPLVSRTINSTPATTPTPSASSMSQRAQSVERKRQATPRSDSLYLGNGSGGADTPAAPKMLFTSTRSLSVSFQGESFTIQVSKAKPTPSPNLRKSTPERRRATTPARGGGGGLDHAENSKPVDQQRWPARMRQANCMTKSLDAEERKKLAGSRGVVRSLQNLMGDVRASFDGTNTLEMGNGEVVKPAEVVLQRNKDGGSELQFEPAASDNESVSSGSSGGEQGLRGGRGIVVPARFWQETNNRLRRQTDPGSPSSRNTGNKTIAPSKNVAPKKWVLDSPISSPRGVINSRGQFSPIRGAVRPASPSKLATPSPTSSMRGVSLSRVRNGVASTLSNTLSNAPSILSFAVDIRRGKIGENRIADAHLLRLLYNRLLQWRFVNARADATLSAQTLNAEKSLYDAWLATSKLRESVRAKRAELQLLKQKVKLISILKKQITDLEDWALMDRRYSSSLSGAIEALKASTLRLPVVCGAKADVLRVKDAIFSALDVMQAMASSVCLLSPKVENVNSLVVDVANLRAKELVSLDDCKDLLSIIAAMQVRECSLRTQIIQSKCLPWNPAMKGTSA